MISEKFMDVLVGNRDVSTSLWYAASGMFAYLNLAIYSKVAQASSLRMGRFANRPTFTNMCLIRIAISSECHG